jgi:predicted TPR repeat methyltransferase
LLRDDGKTADVIIANNVLAHVPDLNGFVAGIATLLKDDGVAVIECPYVRDLIDHCEFDTIYHEHLCYFSVTALSRLFASHGLSLNHVKRLNHPRRVAALVRGEDRSGRAGGRATVGRGTRTGYGPAGLL